MPFQSERQRRYLWANEPTIARRWAHEGGTVKKKKKPSKAAQRHALVNVATSAPPGPAGPKVAKRPPMIGGY